MPSRPEAPGLRRELLAVLLACVFLSGIDSNIVNTALPAIGLSLGAGAGAAWAISSFMLSLAVCTPIFGKLSDVHGRRPMLIAAVLIYTLASAICALAPDITVLIIGRALQGAGISGMTVLASIAVADHVPSRERTHYQAMFMTSYAIASLAGPFFGGLLTQWLGWRWIFIINPPLGLLILVAIVRVWPRDVAIRQVGGSIDYAGAALLTIATACAMAALDRIGAPANRQSAAALAVASLLAIGLLVRVERRAADPFLPLRTIVLPPLPNTLLISILTAFPFFGSIVFLPLYLQLARGLDPMLSGLALAPQVVGLIVSSWAASRIVRAGGSFAACVLCGVSMVSAGLLLIGLVALYGGSLWLLEAAVLVLGLGGGMVRPNLMALVQQAVPRADMGIGTATLTFVHMLAGAAGVGISSALLQVRIDHLSGERGEALLAAAATHRPQAMEVYGGAVASIFLGGGLLALGAVAMAVRLLRRERRIMPEAATGGLHESWESP